ncbi:complement factor H isoform X2 [Candoia aspera]|uniref:complement factor H isoform X2 n=1 Tax=Candoia aspera TaxID=51853 RepID=UPI002FD86825
MAFRFLGYVFLVLSWVCFTAEAAEKECGPPPRRDHEQPVEELIEESFAHGMTISYKCRPGYVKAWAVRVRCNDGIWEQLSPLKNCTGVSCGHPGDADYATFELVRGNGFTFGARVVYTCDEGYKMLSQYDYRDCRANGWTNDVPHCEVNKCFPVAPPANGRIVQGAKAQVDDDFLSGDIVIFGCPGTFKIKGADKITCKGDGTWSAPVPECIEITCQADYIQHGTILSLKNIYKEGERIRFSCDEGYTYVDRSDALCTESGWGTKLECTAIQCRPPQVTNGRFQPRQPQYVYDDEIEISCAEGFIFGGPRKISKCTENGWKPPAICKRKGCDYIRIENGRMSDYYHNQWNTAFPRWEGQTIDFYCYRGFLPENRQTWHRATCINSRFVPEPKCFKTCDPSSRFRHGYFVYTYQNNYIEGDNITFACYDGYSPAEQQSTVRCTRNDWSPVPRCIQPVPVERTCEKVSLPHGYFAHRKQRFQVNEEAKYLCYDGYTTPEGGTEGQTRCLEEGWNPEPKCTKTCQKPPADMFILNSTKSVFFSGDELQYECKEGLETLKKTTGDTVVCSEEGWQSTPACLPIECQTPFLDNGMIHPREDKFLHKMVVHFKCHGGFTRVGSESAQCYHFGWSPQPPICKENVKPCQAPPSILHGVVIGDLKEVYQHGDNLEAQCNISFALHGSKSMECMDGEWAPLPSCIEEVKTCTRPLNIKKGTPVSVKSTAYRHGETVLYECRQRSVITGTNPAKCLHGQWEVPSCLVNPRLCTRPSNAVFQPDVSLAKQFKINEVATYLCGSNQHETKCIDGVWFPEPLCKETCPPPPQLPNAINIAEMRIYRSGEEISFRCKQQFLLRGPQKIKCEDGKWQTPPRCLDLRCSPPPEIDNGVVKMGNRTTFLPGESVEYLCCSGFETDQIKYVKCENKKWSKPPVCKEKSCGVSPRVPNSSLEREDRERYESGEIINYTCNLGFDAKEPTSKTCKKGQWVGSFTCEDTTCPEPPPVEHAVIVEESRKTYLSGQQINYQCNDGFEISGSATVTCTEKKWLRLPRCEDVRCPPPPQLPNGQMNGIIKERYLPMERVSYRCRSGYSLIGRAFITCSKQRWTEAPRCADIGGRCGRPPHVDDGDIVEIPKSYYNTNDRVTYQCQHRYKMIGSPRVTCQNGYWSQTPTCRVPCTASEEDMRQHNIKLRWKPDDKIYSEAGKVVEFECKRGYQPDPASGLFRVPCIEGKFQYPRCIDMSSIIQHCQGDCSSSS